MRLPRPSLSAAWPMLVLPLLLSCNQYDLFRVVGLQQETFTNQADILFVVDNSGSMAEENEAMIANLGVFVEELASEQSGSSEGLVDAVDNYIEFAARRTSFIDFHIGVTSTDVQNHYGALFGDDPVAEFGEADAVADFQAAADEASVPSAVGTEEGLEAVFMALCRAVDDPPEPCFDEINQFGEDDVLSNAGLVREGSAFISVIVTDEGDVSRRMETDPGGTPDSLPDEYAALYDLFGKRMGWAVVGPEPGVCGGEVTVPQWTVARYEYFVDETDGLWIPISTGEPECGVTDFQTALQEIGALINRLLEAFPLQAVPDPDTIVVFVDGDEVPPSTGDGQGGFTDGWFYDPDANAVTFHGSAVPDYGATVRIYYQPISGQPRDLPF